MKSQTGLSGAQLAVVEVGAGSTTPGVVRAPAERVVRKLPGWTLVRVNMQLAIDPADPADRAASIGSDAEAFIHRAASGRSRSGTR